MDRVKQIATEIIRLYRQQLNVWVLGKLGKLKGAEIRDYERRQQQLEKLRRELEGAIAAH